MARDFEDHCWKDIVDDEILEIYQAYHRETYVGDNVALLAIDLYNRAYQGGNRPVLEVNREVSGALGANAWNAIEPCKQLFAGARAAGIPVIYTTRFVHTAGVHSTNRNLGHGLPEDAYDIYKEFTPAPDDLVIYKERASGFFGTPLTAHLQKMNISSLIVLGESTSGCVRASVVDAYSNAYHVTVVEECTFDRSTLSHKVNLFDLHHKYADVMHLDEVLAHLEGLSKTRRVA